MLDRMNSEQARFLASSVVLGVASPFFAYLVVAYLTTGTENMSAPVDRGQFYIGSIGVLAGVLQRLTVPRDIFLNDEDRANKVELIKGALISAIVIAVAVWTAVTIAALTDVDWSEQAEFAAWTGLAFLGASCLVGYKTLDLLNP